MPSYFYKTEEIQQILQIALARNSETDDFSYEQLLDMANELGISPEILVQAEQQWRQQKQQKKIQQIYQSRRQRGFKAHLFAYVAVNTFLLILDFIPDQRLNWSFFALLGWGLGLAFHAWATYRPSE